MKIENRNETFYLLSQCSPYSSNSLREENIAFEYRFLRDVRSAYSVHSQSGNICRIANFYLFLPFPPLFLFLGGGAGLLLLIFFTLLHFSMSDKRDFSLIKSRIFHLFAACKNKDKLSISCKLQLFGIYIFY